MEIKYVNEELLTEFILDIVKAKNCFIYMTDHNNTNPDNTNQVEAICQMWGSNALDEHMNCMLAGWLAAKQIDLKNQKGKDYEDIVLATCRALIISIKEGEIHDSKLH